MEKQDKLDQLSDLFTKGFKMDTPKAQQKEMVLVRLDTGELVEMPAEDLNKL